MKEWVPNREFKKADFSSSKKSDEAKNHSTSKDAASPVKQNPTPNEPITTDLTSKKVVKAWVPPSIDQVVTKKSKRTTAIEKSYIDPANTHELNNATTAELQRSAQRTNAAPVTGASKQADTDISGHLLDELIIARPVETTDLLRNWYWQKSTGGTTPQTKIYVILHSIQKETLVEIYGYFSALERRQMQEIFTKKRTVTKSEILQARSEFMSKLSLSFG